MKHRPLAPWTPGPTGTAWDALTKPATKKYEHLCMDCGAYCTSYHSDCGLCAECENARATSDNTSDLS